MIQQHFLQQQRLNYNHDRLLERYHRLLSPKITEFRTFGTSVLPGRNYDQYLGRLHRGNSVLAQSRASIGASDETYRWMSGGRMSEILPRNIKSVMQHHRSPTMPLVHAERFEPVQIYEHPRFGPTPSYLRPVLNERQHVEAINDHFSDHSDGEEDRTEVSSKTEHTEEKKSSSTDIKKDDDHDHEEPDLAPQGYISHKKWKAKYENLIPVNPLLFNIYTRRPNGSINKYGQSLYASPPRHRRSSLDDDLFTPTSSEIESISSEIPHESSLSSHRRYHRLQQQRSRPKPRPLEPIHTENEFSDDESSPPESPVPYLSRTRQNPLPSTSIIPPTAPMTLTPSALNTLNNNTTEASIGAGDSKTTSTIPPAPPLPPSLTATTTSTTRYETPSSLLISSPPPAPHLPSFLTTSNSATPYQVPSNTSVPPAPSVSESTTKVVTFAGVPSTPAVNDDASSSSDSDDEEKQKRRRRRKRQAEGRGDQSSSSDD